jgi:DNA-binding response OmpR family regulator
MVLPIDSRVTTSERKRIWILEDDESHCFSLDQLLNYRFELTILHDLAAFNSAAVSSIPPHLLLADLRLPDGSFTEYLKATRNTGLGASIPIFVLSGTSDIEALRDCFALGALDYLIKPYHDIELLAKIEKQLAMTRETSISWQSPYRLNPFDFTIFHDGKSSESLTAKEYQLMTLFAFSADGSLQRETIVSTLWPGLVVTPKTLNTHLCNLRAKLRDLNLEIFFSLPDLFSVRPGKSDSTKPLKRSDVRSIRGASAHSTSRAADQKSAAIEED